MTENSDHIPPKSPPQFTKPEIPKPVVARMSRYLRELETLLRSGEQFTNSRQLGQLLGATDSQVRKDLGRFGQFGRPGVGYRCEALIEKIREILGTNRNWNVALIGCGNLGQALLGHKGFEKQGFSIVAAFDTAPEIIGMKIDNLIVQPINDLDRLTIQMNIEMAILAVPPDRAETAANLIMKAGIRGILNFAPITLNLEDQIAIADVDLAMELQKLAYSVQKKQIEKS